MKTARLAVLFAAACTLAAAQRLVLFDFQAVDVEPTTVRTMQLLLRDRLGDAGGFTVVLAPAGTAAATVDEALAAARPLGAEKAVVGTVIRLGSRYIISYKLVDIAAGTVEFGDRATVSDVAELDMATERIAGAIRERKPFAATGEVGKVTAVERSRLSALSSAFLTTGYSFPAGGDFAARYGYMLFTLEAAVSYETPHLLTLGQMGFRRGRLGYNELYFDLLVHRLFSTGDVSPFLGGGIGVHRFWAENQEDDHGPAMVVNGGVILFRTQYFRVTGVARGSVLFTERKGIVPMGGIHFGLTTPTYGSGSSTDVPSPCIYGCLGAFFLVGLVVTLFVQS